MYRLLFFRISEGEAALRFGITWRIIFSLIALLFFVIAFSGGTVVWAALVFGIFSAASALYTEQWKFHQGSQLTSKIGVWPVMRTKTYDISSVSSVIIETPRNIVARDLAKKSWASGHERMGNIFDRRVVRLMLQRSEEGPITLYAEPTRKTESITELAAQLAEFLDVPYQKIDQ